MVANFSQSSKCKTVYSFHLIYFSFQMFFFSPSLCLYEHVPGWRCSCCEARGHRDSRDRHHILFLTLVALLPRQRNLLSVRYNGACAVCVCVLFVQSCTELFHQCPHSLQWSGYYICVCVCGRWWMTPTTTGAEDWMGLNTLKDFLNATIRIWVVFTVWIIHSLHYIMSYQAHKHTYTMWAYTHSSSHSCQSSSLCNSL